MKKSKQYMYLAGCAFLLLTAVFVLFVGGLQAYATLLTGSSSNKTAGGGLVASTACGEAVETLVAGVTMLPSTSGKLGHEEHLSNVKPSHYCGADSGDCAAIAGNGAFSPHTTEQERFYINSQWGGWDWTPTRNRKAPVLSHEPGASDARRAIAHAKLIVTITEPGVSTKSMVTSAEESGPALWVTDRNGVNYGAPPEVYKYLGGSDPYGSPGDGKSQINVGFAKDQSVPLGPCL